MTTSLDMSQKCLEPLESLLHSIVSRLEVIESKLGVDSPPSSYSKTNDDVPAEATVPSSPALVAYEDFLAKNMVPLMDACMKLSLEDAKMKEIGEHTQSSFEAIRHIILLASLCKKPSTTTSGIQTALGSYIKPIQVHLCKEFQGMPFVLTSLLGLICLMNSHFVALVLVYLFVVSIVS